MTDQSRKKLQRRRKLLSNKKTMRLRLFLLALVLILGTGAFLFHNREHPAIAGILLWLKENKPEEFIAPTTPAAPRGNIYDRNFRPLAATFETFTVYARPLEIDEPVAAAQQLEEILGVEKSSLLADLKSERGFVWVARDIDRENVEAIKNLNLKGIYRINETKRYYPGYETAAHAIGFVEDEQGLDGIEFQYNSLLRGDEMTRAELESLKFNTSSEFNGSAAHLVLNLDLMIQARIESYLKKRIKITGARSGSVLLMDAETGGILAVASFPSFNPNRYWEFSSSALNNQVLSEPVYPGELGLIFQQAAAINLKNEKKSYSPDYESGTEPLLIIEPEVLKRRKLSTAPRIASVEPEYFALFTEKLGFSHKLATDIPLKNEALEPASLLPIDPLFYCSALRLLTGFTTLVNNGRMVTPHLLHMAYPRDNAKPFAPELSGPVKTDLLHPDTSRDLIDFLAAKWLKIRPSRTSGIPLFFESHRYGVATNVSEQDNSHSDQAGLENTAPRLLQSVMLGAIPGRDPKLTMIAVLSYPDDNDEIYSDALESLGKKFSLLKPDQDMIQKMAYLAEQSPPVPSPDFWANSGIASASSIYAPVSENNDYSARVQESKKHMPDVTGKSLRAGLQALQHFKLHISLVGSGRIVEQHPAAGAEINNGSKCILKMQLEI